MQEEENLYQLQTLEKDKRCKCKQEEVSIKGKNSIQGETLRN